MIKMSWADYGLTEKKYLNDVLESGWISRRKYIPRFEQTLASLHGQKYGIFMNSGTDALRIALATLKEIYQWPNGSEVIVPALTFVATVNIVLQNNLTPVFVDVDRYTYNLDPELIGNAISAKTKAIIPVHLFGRPADMDSIMEISRTRRLRIIEDSCETMFVHKIRGDMACFSSYMAHLIQTGVGGVLTSNSATYDAVARSYMNHGRDANPNRYRFERIGYSSRATEMEAALGCAQLERYQMILRKRVSLAMRLWEDLRGLPIQLPRITGSSWMFFPIVLEKGSRDKFMTYLREHGIETRQMMPLTDQPCYKRFVKEKDYPVAQWINKNGVCLPSHQSLTDRNIQYVVRTIKGFFRG